MTMATPLWLLVPSVVCISTLVVTRGLVHVVVTLVSRLWLTRVRSLLE